MIKGVLSVEYNGSYQEILSHFHTHPILYNGLGGDSIGVSFADLNVYTHLESYGVKIFSNIRNCIVIKKVYTFFVNADIIP